MTKKVLIFCICLVTICTVLGLNDKLTYTEPAIDENGNVYTKTGFEIAFDMVVADASIVREDFNAISVFTTLVGNYSPSTTTTIETYDSTDSDEPVYDIVVQILRPGGDNELKVFVFEDKSTRDQLYELLVPLTRPWTVPDGDGFFDSTLLALDTIGFVISIIFVVIMFVLLVLLDVAGIVIGLFEAAFYLLGF